MSTPEFRSPSSAEQKQLARAELRRVIDRTIAAGVTWDEILRTLAECGPADDPGNREAPASSKPRK